MSFNPVNKVFDTVQSHAYEVSMSLSGTLTKIALLLATLAIGAGGAWYLFSQNIMVGPLLIGSLISAVLLSFATVFWPHIARFTAVPYALSEGICLGMISSIFEIKAPGIAVLAVTLTGATATAMLLLYRLGIIKVTETFKAVIFSATAGIALTYGVLMLAGLFGAKTASFFTSSSWVSIGFSLFVVAIAAFNLLIDFQRIEDGVERELPQYMEWYSAFSILVTLVWLYLEILRLLMKLSARKD